MSQRHAIMIWVAVMALALAGCMASAHLEQGIIKSKDNRWIATHTRDDIIAIGQPKRPIDGYEGALVLVGRQHDYLLTSVFGSSEKLGRVLQGVDLRYLYVDLHKQTHLVVKQAGGDYACPSAFGCIDDVTLVLKKPSNQVTHTEKDKLETLGFRCHGSAELLSCYYNTYRLSLTMTTKNHHAPKHSFKAPAPIVFYEFHAHKGKAGRVVRRALMPLAIAFDVVTFPIQLGILDINK